MYYFYFKKITKSVKNVPQCTPNSKTACTVLEFKSDFLKHFTVYHSALLLNFVSQVLQTIVVSQVLRTIVVSQVLQTNVVSQVLQTIVVSQVLQSQGTCRPARLEKQTECRAISRKIFQKILFEFQYRLFYSFK